MADDYFLRNAHHGIYIRNSNICIQNDSFLLIYIMCSMEASRWYIRGFAGWKIITAVDGPF